MENIYYSINDNIIEFISLNQSIFQTFCICVLSRNLFSHFHNFKTLIVVHDKSFLYLNKFKQLKSLIFNIVINSDSLKMLLLNQHQLNYLKIPADNFQNIDLTPLSNLTSLCIEKYSNEIYAYKPSISNLFYLNQRNIRKLTSLCDYYSKYNFDSCYNLEELYVHHDEEVFFHISIYSKLTKLTIKLRTRSRWTEPYVKFTPKLPNFENIIELNLFEAMINFNQHIFPSLTSLTSLKMCIGDTICNMPKLKKMHLSRHGIAGCITIDANELIDVCLENFRVMYFKHCGYQEKSNCMIFKSTLSNLISLNINSVSCPIFVCLDSIKHVSNVTLNGKIFRDTNELIQDVKKKCWIVNDEMDKDQFRTKNHVNHLILTNNRNYTDFTILQNLILLTIVNDDDQMWSTIIRNPSRNVEIEYLTMEQCVERYHMLIT